MGVVQKESLRLTIVSYIGAILGYVNKILLFTNFLSPSQNGLTQMLINASVLYAQFVALGMSSISLRFFPFFNDKKKGHHGFLFWGTVIIFIGFLISTILFLLIKPWVNERYSQSSPMFMEYYNYLIPMALALAYFQFFDSYLRSLLKTVVATFVYEFLGRLFVSACIALYAFKWIDFHQFVILFVSSNIILTIILLVYMAYLKQLHFFPQKSTLFKRLFKPIMIYGIFTIMSAIGGSIIGNVDSFMVAGKLNLAQAGIYTTAFLVASILSFPQRSIIKISQPIIARYWKSKDMMGMAELYDKATITNMVIGGILFLGIWVNIDSIFSFMPKEYSAGKYAFLFLALSRYFDMATGLNGIITLTSKKYRYDLYFLILLVILTILLNYALIPVWGITGAAIAAFSCMVIYNIIRLLFVQYYFKIQPFTINCFWIFLVTIGAWLISLLIPQTGNRFVNIAVNSFIVIVAYGLPVLLLKLSPDVNMMAYNITKWKFLLPGEKPTS